MFPMLKSLLINKRFYHKPYKYKKNEEIILN